MELAIVKLERHICTLYIIYATKTGASAERVSYDGRTFLTWVARATNTGALSMRLQKSNPQTRNTAQLRKKEQSLGVTGL